MRTSCAARRLKWMRTDGINDWLASDSNRQLGTNSIHTHNSRREAWAEQRGSVTSRVYPRLKAVTSSHADNSRASNSTAENYKHSYCFFVSGTRFPSVQLTSTVQPHADKCPTSLQHHISTTRGCHKKLSRYFFSPNFLIHRADIGDEIKTEQPINSKMKTI